jgi:hypothetical protein
MRILASAIQDPPHPLSPVVLRVTTVTQVQSFRLLARLELTRLHPVTMKRLIASIAQVVPIVTVVV